MTDTPPFAAPRYLLDSCELRVIHNTEEARFLSRLLAGLDPWRTLRYTADALERYLLHPDAALYRYMVVSQGKMIGVVCTRYPWLRGAYLELIGLDAAYQGLGVGGGAPPLARGASAARVLQCVGLSLSLQYASPHVLCAAWLHRNRYSQRFHSVRLP